LCPGDCKDRHCHLLCKHSHHSDPTLTTPPPPDYATIALHRHRYFLFSYRSRPIDPIDLCHHVTSRVTRHTSRPYSLCQQVPRLPT
jgi:hypothetical protein